MQSVSQEAGRRDVNGEIDKQSGGTVAWKSMDGQGGKGVQHERASMIRSGLGGVEGARKLMPTKFLHYY